MRAGNLKLPVWELRKDPVNALLTAAAPDIVGLQEASPEQQVGLRSGLPDYTLVYDLEANNTNPILFRKERFRLLDSGVLVLNAEPEVPDTNIGVRRCTWIHLEERKSGQRLRVYNLHLDHRSKGPTRQISAVRLVEHIVARGDPTIVTGDFNTAETSPTMTYFYGQTPLNNDAGKAVHNPAPLVDAYKAVPHEDAHKLIDHVLAGPGWKVRTAGLTPSGTASDHNIIRAELEFPTPGGLPDPSPLNTAH